MYDELRGNLRAHATHFSVHDETSLLLLKAADAIEELQQIANHYEEAAHDYWKDVCYYMERVPKWIPVTERLPEDDGEVLCINDYHFYIVGWLYCDDAGNYICESDNEIMYDVTHWMPLPSPPKADKDGAE